MPDDWNEDIMVCELSDEPALGEELAAVIDRAEASTPASPADASRAVKHTVLNFSAVRYISSSHLAQLIRLRRALSNCGKELVLCALSDNLWSVILMSGLDRIFRFAPDPLTALATLQLELSPESNDES
ncbi:MAG: STAS domain-containing protein [Phycisphaerales bacterium]|nr:STAS domain-containing protein [Phycisphaerales bacterium]